MIEPTDACCLLRSLGLRTSSWNVSRRDALCQAPVSSIWPGESVIEKSGGSALPISTDVADADAVDAAAEQVERELGPIDVWINNAMATIFAPLHEIEPDEYRRATETTYLGSVWGTMAALRRMRPRNRGTIVFVGSALA